MAALIEATKQNSFEEILNLLNGGINVNYQDECGKSALMYAAQIGHIEIVTVLLEHDASYTDVDNTRYNALLHAAWKGQTEVVKILIAKGADINSINTFTRNALMEASLMGHIETVCFLLTKDSNIKQRDSFGNSALLLASQAGHLDVVILLLDGKASISDVNYEGYNALLLAAQGGHTSVVKFLIEKNIDINCTNYSKRNALMEACLKGHTKTVQFLLTKQFNIKEADTDGNTALLLACKAGNNRTVKLLLQYKASLMDLNKQGNNALLVAANSGHTEIVKFILLKNDDINYINTYHRNALMEASFMGHRESVCFLLTRNFNISQRDDDGNNALLLACSHGHLSIVELLLQHGASLTDKNNNGYNALLLSAYNGYTDIARFLIENKADIKCTTTFQYNALMLACWRGNTETVKLLLSQDFNIQQSDTHGYNALSLACYTGSLSIVELILQHKASLVNVNMALLEAARQGHTEVVKFLINKNADVKNNDSCQRNPLMVACLNGRTETITFLLTQDCNIQQRDNEGNSALLLACSGGHLRTVQLLLQRRVSLTDVNQNGDNALLISAKRGYTQLVRFLIEKGLDQNSVNLLQQNALMLACLNGHTATVRILLRNNINFQQKDSNGNTALLLAVQAGNLDNVELLLENKASLTDVNNDGYNALSIAAQKGHTEIVTFLMNKNNDIYSLNKFKRNALMEACYMGHTETVQVLLKHVFNITQTDGEGKSAFNLAVGRNMNSSMEFAKLNDVYRLNNFNNLDICFILMFFEVLSNGKWPIEMTTLDSKTVKLNKILRFIKDTEMSLALPNELLQNEIASAVDILDRGNGFNTFEFYVYQKFFERVYNIMLTKSTKENSDFGNYITILKYTEFTIRPMRENNLLDIDAPVFINVILQTLTMFSNFSKKLAESMVQHGIFGVLIKRLRYIKVQSLSKEWTQFTYLSACIILNCILIVENIDDIQKKELITVFKTFVEINDINSTTCTKLLILCLEGTGQLLYPSKGVVQTLAQWILQGNKNVNRSFNNLSITTLLKCLRVICLRSVMVYEILDADILNCLNTVMHFNDTSELEAAVDCLLAIAEKMPGNYHISQHEGIMTLLTTLQQTNETSTRKKAVSVLWLVKHDAIILNDFIEITAPGFPEQWKKSKRLGNGNFGGVHLLQDTKDEHSKKYVMKEIGINSDDTDTIFQKNSELAVLMKTNHSKLVQFFGFKLKSTKIILFFEYMCLGSLRSYVKNKGNLQETKIKMFSYQILLGLNYLHRFNPPIIHRDIKGDNILLEDEDSVKIADFGLSKLVTESSYPNSIMGTAKWMAPEMLDSGEDTTYNCKADLWSFACTVVEMATTEPPWPKHNPKQHMLQLAKCAKPVYDLPVDSSQELKMFLEKMFQNDPKQRPSAAELFDDPFLENIY
ncbi:ankyrin-3-like [Physella acuta]|uniref:ankyrin-3-like n=1 Tax=Physella acuta TaxID=109671 RepID=UPI0027DC5A2C|nr:ankyrin-3-like [Physella acuta]XP_059151250.1 ankyrin-3-like [Physella acuta]